MAAAVALTFGLGAAVYFALPSRKPAPVVLAPADGTRPQRPAPPTAPEGGEDLAAKPGAGGGSGTGGSSDKSAGPAEKGAAHGEGAAAPRGPEVVEAGEGAGAGEPRSRKEADGALAKRDSEAGKKSPEPMMLARGIPADETVLANTARNAAMLPAVQQALTADFARRLAAERLDRGAGGRPAARRRRGIGGGRGARAAPATDDSTGAGRKPYDNYNGNPLANANGNATYVFVVAAPNPQGASEEIKQYLSSNRIAWDNVDASPAGQTLAPHGGAESQAPATRPALAVATPAAPALPASPPAAPGAPPVYAKAASADKAKTDGLGGGERMGKSGPEPIALGVDPTRPAGPARPAGRQRPAAHPHPPPAAARAPVARSRARSRRTPARCAAATITPGAGATRSPAPPRPPRALKPPRSRRPRVRRASNFHRRCRKRRRPGRPSTRC